MKVVLINGHFGSGKDTFVEFVKQAAAHYGGYVCNISTVDFVKKVAAFCGWNGEKEPADRKFLSELKRILGEWRDVPIKKVKERIRTFKDEVETFGGDEKDILIFIHIREPDELERMKKELNAYTLFITRPDVDKMQTSNSSDEHVADFGYDIYVQNSGTLDDLQCAADSVYRMIVFDNFIEAKEKRSN